MHDAANRLIKLDDGLNRLLSIMERQSALIHEMAERLVALEERAARHDEAIESLQRRSRPEFDPRMLRDPRII